MLRVLVPVTDRSEIECAARHVLARYQGRQVLLYLVNVQLPIPRFVARFVNRRQLDEFHRESGMQILEPLADRLAAAGIPCQMRVLVGLNAETIACFAREHHCDHIMVARQKGVLDSMGLGSIGSQLRHLLGGDGGCVVNEVY